MVLVGFNVHLVTKITRVGQIYECGVKWFFFF